MLWRSCGRMAWLLRDSHASGLEQAMLKHHPEGMCCIPTGLGSALRPEHCSVQFRGSRAASLLVLYRLQWGCTGSPAVHSRKLFKPLNSKA